MNDVKVPAVFLVVQLFTAFVAIATLFGRVAFIRYYELLGLPLEDGPENLLVYVIMFPDITIASFGIAASVIFMIYFRRQIRSAIDRMDNKILFAGSNIVSGVFIFSYSALPLLERNQYFNSSRLPEGIYGLLFVLGYLMIQSGIAFLARWHLARSRSKSTNKINEEPIQNQDSVKEGCADSTKDNGYTLIFDISFIAVSTLILMIWFVMSTSERNAWHDYRYARDAQIVWSSGLDDLGVIDNLQCDEAYRICNVGIVAIRGQFLYLRRAEYNLNVSESWPDGMVIYSMRLEDIKRIVYFP